MDLNPTDPNQIKQLIQLLQNLLPPEDTSTQSENKDEEFSTKIKTKTRSTKSKNSNNKFLKMAEKNMHKEDTEIDQKLSKNPPTPRTRKFKPLNVRCRVCGKNDQISPSIVSDPERYKCNKCSGSAGG